MTNYPTTRTCDACFLADYVTDFKANHLTGLWYYQCFNPVHGESPHRWTVTPPKAAPSAAPQDGELARLGVYEDLPLCIHPDDPWLEYGVVEDRYRRLRPGPYAELILKYSHSRRNAIRGGPDVNPDQSPKTSSRLASALSNLAGAGLIAKSVGPATGYWGYNVTISHWAPLPAPDEGRVLTWSAYAIENGLDPEDWDLP